LVKWWPGSSRRLWLPCLSTGWRDCNGYLITMVITIYKLLVGLFTFLQCLLGTELLNLSETPYICPLVGSIPAKKLSRQMQISWHYNCWHRHLNSTAGHSPEETAISDQKSDASHACWLRSVWKLPRFPTKPQRIAVQDVNSRHLGRTRRNTWIILYVATPRFVIGQRPTDSSGSCFKTWPESRRVWLVGSGSQSLGIWRLYIVRTHILCHRDTTQ
jgi:hypothetical protein